MKEFRDRRRNGGFTLMEILIVVAVIVILVAIAITAFSGYLEKSREATDLANVRSAYSEVMVAALLQDTSDPLYDGMLDRYYKTVQLVQKKDGWSIDTDTLNIGGIAHSDSVHWKGDAKAEGNCVVYYDNKTGETTLIWGGYKVYINYQWKVGSDGRFYMSEGSWDNKNWPASAVPELIDAKNNSGQTVVVDAITDEYPALKKWIDRGGGFEIGIFTIDSDGKELEDTGGTAMSSEEAMTFEIKTDKAEDGADVRLGIQFFKMKSSSNRSLGSVVMTAEEARELERIFSITGQ